MVNIDCTKCKRQHACCESGAWVDLDEAKRIAKLGLRGVFYHLEEDKDYPSGWRVGTSYELNKCTFLDKKGLCTIHKIDYNIKPSSCKEFPYEDGRVAPYAKELCPVYIRMLKKRRAKSVKKKS